MTVFSFCPLPTLSRMAQRLLRGLSVFDRHNWLICCEIHSPTMATRGSSRQAAMKAKEAIANTSEPKPLSTAGAKRKGSVDKGPVPKKEKKIDQEANQETKGPSEEAGKPVKEPGKTEPEKPANGVKAGVRESQEREDIVPSSILEKGIVYFFYRPRVNVEEAHGINEVARSFIVLRPTPKGAIVDQQQGSLEPGARCRLMVLPKKKFPTSAKERDLAFVEKAGQSMKALQESFISERKYETSTRGERTVEEARPYAEGVYAISSTKRSSHLAYILTIPEEIGSLQEDFGLQERGSWIVQAKNPKYPGPPNAQFAKTPEYPEKVREKFSDYRWVPLEPDFIEYPNAQILMIGAAQGELGKAAVAEPDGKQAHEEQPGEELEKLEHENEERIEVLQGNATIYKDLGLDAKNYPRVPTTWNNES